MPLLPFPFILHHAPRQAAKLLCTFEPPPYTADAQLGLLPLNFGKWHSRRIFVVVARWHWLPSQIRKAAESASATSLVLSGDGGPHWPVRLILTIQIYHAN